MRCLNEIVQPVEKSGKRDIYGHLTYLVRAASMTKEASSKEEEKKKSTSSSTVKAKKNDTVVMGDREEVEQVEAALRQLEVVRYSLSQNLARCFMG